MPRPEAPLEGSLDYWRELCAGNSRVGVIDSERRGDERWWWVYRASDGRVFGPYPKSAPAYDRMRTIMWLAMRRHKGDE